jgi:hypothetical protein
MKKYLYSLGLVLALACTPSAVYSATLASYTVTCAAPNAQPTNIGFVNTFSDNTFVRFTPTQADGYLVVLSTSTTLTASPVNGVNYTAGQALGNATVVSASEAYRLPIYNLNPQTNYTVFVFAYNNAGCGTDIYYNAVTPLTASFTTIANSPYMPAAQPVNLVFNPVTDSSVTGSFTASGTDNYLIVMANTPTLTATPVEHYVYEVGSDIGNGTVVGAGNATTFTVNNLTPNTNYYFFVYAYSNQATCQCILVYRTSQPLAGVAHTQYLPCQTPTTQATALLFNTPTSSSVSGSFSPTTADGYLVVYSTSPTLTSLPTNGTTYTVGATLGNSTILSFDNTAAFSASGLTSGTLYYFTVFASNNSLCSNGPVYNTTTPLKGSVTIASTGYNYYFGNFHSHSEYSDGTGLPSGDFAYGDAAECMDFLGISEHNHVAAGMALANWSLGRAQAAAATTSTFLALYGMEWGVISGGGHVIVYGVPDLLGWDPGQYNTFVAKNDYIGTAGLFPVINNYGGNAFATLAHPNTSDYGGIASTYNAAADNAIVGTAVENGPSTSTNTTYSDPPTSMAYLSYFRSMLARGYHLGPTVDHDNHNVTHGHTTRGRTVVLANSLTENNILDAMRHMRFYASEDCSAYVTYKINNNPMGSILATSGAPSITVNATTSSPITSIKVYAGVPGSGSAATILTSTTASSINYTDNALSTGSTKYYYIDITEADGKRIITSPIWYTKTP